MPAEFEGCETGGLFIKATSTECSDGRVLITPDIADPDDLTEEQIVEAVWGFVGQPIHANAGDGEMYAAMFVDCNDF